MNIKELLLEGMVIKMSYKERKEEWVGDVSIWIFAGGFGMHPKVTITGSLGHQDYELDLLDSAIEHFTKSVLSEKNLMYKRNEAMILTTKDVPDIDLENEVDYQIVEVIRLKLIRESQEINFI